MAAGPLRHRRRSAADDLHEAAAESPDVTHDECGQHEHARLLSELHAAREQLEHDLDAMNRVFEIGSLYLHEGNMTAVLEEIVDAAIDITSADFGNIQLLDRESGDLMIVAHQGFPHWWLEFWESVTRGRGSCGTALGRRERVIIEDVEHDPVFVGTAALEVQLEAGVRAVQSTPLIGRAGAPIGMLSTHFRTPQVPSARALRMLDIVARQAADIIERMQAEEALRSSEQRLRALVEASSEVLYRMSADWREMRELHGTGFLAETLATSKTWFERYIHPDDQPGVKSVIEDAIRNKRVFTLEHRVVRADGTLGWTWSRAVPVTDTNGEIVEWFGAASDVTERKRAELALSEAVQRLEAADRHKTDFLAMLSHELRNPLAPILNSIEILEAVAEGGDQASHALAVMRRQVEHLTHLVGDLLDVTRISRGKIALQREVLDLDELVKRTVADHREAFLRANVELEMLAAPAAVWVNGDRTRLVQVIGNLLNNALKFTPPGGKTSVSLVAEARQVVIRVRDTGLGIEARMLGRLFQPFMQADMPLDRQKGGLGLGLAICKSLAEMHGGSAAASSEGLGRGTTIAITLPIAAAPPAVVERRVQATTHALRHVLVIEDNVDAADTLRTLLERRGHKVAIAGSGPEGIERARASHPDVVLCDIGLPEMDGFEVARTMRATPELQEIPLVAVSGYGQPEDVEMAKEAGFDAHVTKPFGMDGLERAVATSHPPAHREARISPRRGASRRRESDEL